MLVPVLIIFAILFMVAFYAIATVFDIVNKSFNEDEESIMEFEQRIPKWVRRMCGIRE